jgi:hypothetical protein
MLESITMIQSFNLKLTEPFKFGSSDNAQVFKATGGNDKQIFYKDFNRDTGEIGKEEKSRDHCWVYSLWSRPDLTVSKTNYFLNL